MKQIVPMALVIAMIGCTPAKPPTGTTPAASTPTTPAPAPPAPPAAPSPPPPAPSAAVPARFQGVWSSDPACAAGHESHLRIGPHQVAFHESSGPITTLTSSGDDLDLAVTLSGEGDTFARNFRFRLSDSDNTLTDRDSGLARMRCGR